MATNIVICQNLWIFTIFTALVRLSYLHRSQDPGPHTLWVGLIPPTPLSMLHTFIGGTLPLTSTSPTTGSTFRYSHW